MSYNYIHVCVFLPQPLWFCLLFQINKKNVIIIIIIIIIITIIITISIIVIYSYYYLKQNYAFSSAFLASHQCN